MRARVLSAGLIAGACAALVIAGPKTTIRPPLKTTPIPEPTTAEIFQPAVMIYTPDQADAVLERIAEEKRAAEEAARRAEEKRRAEQYSTGASYSAGYFREMGVIYWGAWRWTWYSERVLPGSGLHIPGRHTDGSGYVRDGDGYLCLASDNLARGTVIDTPFGGAGRVYDTGAGSGTIDVYVGW